MASFTKRDLLQTILLTIVTFGFYSIYWSVVTKRELNRAGGNVPNAFLIVVPFVNLYFWYRYAQAYTKIVLRNNDSSEVNLSFLIAILPQISRYFATRHDTANLHAIHGKVHELVLNHGLPKFPRLSPLISPLKKLMILLGASSLIAFVLLIIFSITIFKIAYFQKGFNDYQG